jgi:hypothetical protein
MDPQTIGMIFAVIGVVATIAYLLLGGTAVKLLKDIRDQNDESKSGSSTN